MSYELFFLVFFGILGLTLNLAIFFFFSKEKEFKYSHTNDLCDCIYTVDQLCTH